jgi:hypothetical protein
MGTSCDTFVCGLHCAVMTKAQDTLELRTWRWMHPEAAVKMDVFS